MTLARTVCTVAAAATLLAVLAAHLLPDAPPPDAPPRPASAPAHAAGHPLAPSSAPAAAHAGFATAPAAPLYGRNGRAVDLHGLDVATYIARRNAAARTGDMRAAYDIYQATSLCAAAADPLPEFADAADRTHAEAERARVQTLCAGVSAVQLQERMAFLGQAARAGNRDARIDFFMEGPQGRPLDPGTPADDPQLQAWKAQALGFLQQAGAQCDHFALALLANAYDLGQLVPRDPRMTMAYAIASAAARHATLTEQQLRARFGTDLTDADFAAARQAGTQLARQDCPAGR